MIGQPEPKSDDTLLNPRQQRFCEYVARGESLQHAAKLAGFRPSTAKKASRLLRCPAVAKEIEQIRLRGRELAAYDVKTAMEEAKQDHAFAISKGNAMAAVKATELRSKLSGLLIEKVEVVAVDLTKALAEAERRAFGGPITVNVTPTGPTSWAPRIAGDSNGQVENAEAGTR